MTCLECQFRNECNEVEPDDVWFKLCGIRIEKLSKIELIKMEQKAMERWKEEMKKRGLLDE